MLQWKLIQYLFENFSPTGEQTSAHLVVLRLKHHTNYEESIRFPSSYSRKKKKSKTAESRALNLNSLAYHNKTNRLPKYLYAGRKH